jgi:hypothetical protein
MFGSCERRALPSLVRDAVLSKGETIEALNRYGKITVSYVDALRRRYTWDGNDRVVTLTPRRAPFQGKLGLYEPANAWIFRARARLVVEETIRRFDTQEQMQAALLEGAEYFDWVYTDYGLVVGFGRTPSRKQVNITVWQFLIGNQKPTHLIGATPEKVAVRHASSG